MNNKNCINIYGASGHAKVVLDIILSNSTLDIGYVFDDNKNIKSLLGNTVYSPKIIDKLKTFPLVIAIGNNKIRKHIVENIETIYTQPLIHKTAVISEFSELGLASVVMPNAVINSSSVIGKHCIVNTSAVIEHDVNIKDFSHISPNATVAGNVNIGYGTQIGAGAIVLPNITIGKWCVIGAGAVVTKNVEDFTTVVGNPAKILYQ